MNRLLLAVAGTAILVAGFGELMADHGLALRATAVALVALAGYAAAHRRALLAAGFGVLTVQAVVAMLAYPPPVEEHYLIGSISIGTDPDPFGIALAAPRWWHGIATFGPALLAYGVLVAALVAAPHRWRPRVAWASAGLALVFGALAVADLAGWMRSPATTVLTLASAVPPLLVTVVAAVAAGVSGHLARGAWPATVGALLLVLTALIMVDATLRAHPPTWPPPEPGFVLYGYLVSTGTAVRFTLDVAVPVVRLAGLVLLAVGCARGSAGRRERAPAPAA
jgi:hypothetical protein